MAKKSKIRPADLDSYDIAILEILQRDCSLPQRKIGEMVNLSAAAVQRRIARMQGAVIEQTVAVLNPTSIGRPITVLAEVQLENERIDKLDAMKARFKAAPEVQQCYYVTGETDFILVISVASMQDYEELTKTLFFNDQNIKYFKTLVVMDRVKSSQSYPLDQCADDDN